MATANAIPFLNPAPHPDRPAIHDAEKRDAPKAQASSRSGNPEAASPKPFSKWQQDVLELLAFGSSVAAAMRAVKLAETTFYKTCHRHPAFQEAVDHARAYYRVQVEDAFHEADAYARVLVDRIQRDENLKPHLRLRAALAILNRKPGKWLPHAVPVPACVPNFSLPEGPAGCSNPQEPAPHKEAEGRHEDPSEARPPQPPSAQNVPGNPKTLETLDTLDTGATGEDFEELLEDQALIEELDALYGSLFPAQTLDTLDKLDTDDYPNGLRAALARADQQKPSSRQSNGTQFWSGPEGCQ